VQSASPNGGEQDTFDGHFDNPGGAGSSKNLKRKGSGSKMDRSGSSGNVEGGQGAGQLQGGGAAGGGGSSNTSHYGLDDYYNQLEIDDYSDDDDPYELKRKPRGYPFRNASIGGGNSHISRNAGHNSHAGAQFEKHVRNNPHHIGNMLGHLRSGGGYGARGAASPWMDNTRMMGMCGVDFPNRMATWDSIHYVKLWETAVKQLDSSLILLKMQSEDFHIQCVNTIV
jgi:hypothetical protein